MKQSALAAQSICKVMESPQNPHFICLRVVLSPYVLFSHASPCLSQLCVCMCACMHACTCVCVCVHKYKCASVCVCMKSRREEASEGGEVLVVSHPVFWARHYVLGYITQLVDWLPNLNLREAGFCASPALTPLIITLFNCLQLLSVLVSSPISYMKCLSIPPPSGSYRSGHQWSGGHPGSAGV